MKIGMAWRIGPGEYQIGIYHVRRVGRRWESRATGPGTIGDGSPVIYPTFRAAYQGVTGEPVEFLARRKPKARTGA